MNWLNFKIFILASIHLANSANNGILGLGGILGSVLGINKARITTKPKNGLNVHPGSVVSNARTSLKNNSLPSAQPTLLANLSSILSGAKRSRGKLSPAVDLTCDGEPIRVLPQFLVAKQTCNAVAKSGQPFFCSIKCIMTNLGWIGEDGQVDVEKLVATIGSLIPNELEEGFLQNGITCADTARKMREAKWKTAIERTERMNCLDVVPLVSCLSRVYYYICGVIVDDLLWMISPDSFDYLAIDSVCDSYTVFYPDEFRNTVASCADTENTPSCRRRCEWKKMEFFDSAGFLNDNKIGEFFNEIYPMYKKEMEQGLEYCYQAHPPIIVSPGRDCRKSVPFFRCMQNLYYHICRRYEPVPELQ